MDLLTNSAFDYELRDGNITAIASVGERLLVATESCLLIELKLILEDNSVTWKREREFQSKDYITHIAVDEKMEMIFFKEANSKGIYIFDFSTFEVLLSFHDEKQQFKSFKFGVINVGKDIVTYSLDESFFYHRIVFQSKDNVLFIYQYANKEKTPKMKKITEQIFKRKSTYIFLCKDFLVLHFEGKTKVHVFKIQENGTLERIKIRKDDKNLLPETKKHTPQLIYLKPEGRASLCLMRCGKKVYPILLGEKDGVATEYDGIFKYQFKRFTIKPLSPIAFSFPLIAGVCNKPNIQVEFKNMMNQTNNPKDCTSNPPAIKETKEFSFIIASKDCFYATSQNKIIPIFYPTFEYLRDSFYKENLDQFVPILEITKNKVDYDIVGKKYSIILGSLMNLKFKNAFDVMKQMKQDSYLREFFDIRVFLNKFPKFEDDMTLTEECILPEEYNPLKFEKIKLLSDDLKYQDRDKKLLLLKAENHLIDFLEECKTLVNNSMEQKAIDYCLLMLCLQRVDDYLDIYDRILRHLKSSHFINYNDEIFVKLMKNVKHQRIKGVYYGMIGSIEQSLKILFELFSDESMLKNQGEKKENLIEDMVEFLSNSEDYNLIMKYANKLMDYNEKVSIKIFTTKRKNLTFNPQKIKKFLEKYSLRSMEEYSFYLITQENHQGTFFITNFVTFTVTLNNEGKDVSNYRNTLNKILTTINIDKKTEDIIMKSNLNYEKSIILKKKDQIKESFQYLIQSTDFGRIEQMVNEIYDKNHTLATELIIQNVLISNNNDLFTFGINYIKTRNISITDSIQKLDKDLCNQILQKFFQYYPVSNLNSQSTEKCTNCGQLKQCFKCKQCHYFDLCIICYNQISTIHFKEYPNHYFLFSDNEKLRLSDEFKVNDELHNYQISKFHEYKKKQRIKLKIEPRSPFLSPLPPSPQTPTVHELRLSTQNQGQHFNPNLRKSAPQITLQKLTPKEHAKFEEKKEEKPKLFNIIGKFLSPLTPLTPKPPKDEIQEKDRSSKRVTHDFRESKTISRSDDYIPNLSKKQAPLNRQFTNHKINFQSVFFEEEMKKGFIEHLKKENNLNPFEFLTRIYKLENVTSKDTIDEFYDICNVFIKEDSENSINISAPVRRKLLEIFKKDKSNWEEKDTPLELLSGAKNIIIRDLKFDSFPRFIYSDLGYDILQKNLSNTNIISTSESYAILYKLQESFYFEKLKHDELKEYALDLSDPNRMKYKYFNTQWTESIKHQKRIRKSIVFKKDGFEVPVIDSLVQTIHQKQLSKNVKIKIVLLDKNCSSMSNRVKRGAGRFLSPILYHMNQEYEEEGCYSALMIGPWLLYWDDSNLCVPKKCVHTATLLSADIKSIYSLQNLDDSLDKLANLITRWNTMKTYKAFGGDKEFYGNSQDFIEDVLKAIGVQLNVPKPLENCLKTIQEKGSTNLELQMSIEFKNKFNIKESTIIFQTHLELDTFVRNLIQIDNHFHETYSDEFEFLKSLDRTFWMRYYGSKDTNLEKSSIPHQDCPFQDPVKTHSFII